MNIKTKGYSLARCNAYSIAGHISGKIGESKHGASCVLVLNRQPLSVLLPVFLQDSGIDCTIELREGGGFFVFGFLFDSAYPFIYLRNAKKEQIIALAESILRQGVADVVLVKLLCEPKLYILTAT